jgi:hypothetical protein
MSTWGLLHVLHCVQPDATLPGKPKSSMLAPKSVFWVGRPGIPEAGRGP